MTREGLAALLGYTVATRLAKAAEQETKAISKLLLALQRLKSSLIWITPFPTLKTPVSNLLDLWACNKPSDLTTGSVYIVFKERTQAH